MSILIDGVPGSILVSGQEYPVRTDFRVWLRFDKLMEKFSGSVNVLCDVISLCVEPGPLPEDINALLAALVEFYATGENANSEKKSEKASTKSVPVIDYEHDAAYIYAAFLEQYRIDLTETPHLHWWKFQALLRSLSESSKIVKIAGYRSVDTGTIKDKKQRQLYEKLKAVYALPDTRSKEEKERAFTESLARLF